LYSGIYKLLKKRFLDIRVRNMEGDIYLSDKDRVILKEFNRACLDKKTANKIKDILLLMDLAIAD
jgi:hypothetical protein